MHYHVLISSTNKLIFRFPKLSSKYIYIYSVLQASGSLFSSCRGRSGRDTKVPAARMDCGGAGPGLAWGQAFSHYRGMGSLTLATTFSGGLMCGSRGSTWQMLLEVLGAAAAGAAVAGRPWLGQAQPGIHSTCCCLCGALGQENVSFVGTTHMLVCLA